jgi:hypothetical protein
MERELLLTIKKIPGYNIIVDREIAFIKRLLPYFESFETFSVSAEVIDLEKKKFIQSRNKLKQIFNEGSNEHSRYIFCLN